ncbi:unnamed protein product [Meloidogyne enterolobii]|uniref:Uncharacterized protein n=1 Tax=Meloidogyne enterolobii TaxID=390850 RepID=A0ACB1A7W2_MELEN
MEADLLVNDVTSKNTSSEVRAGEVKTIKFEVKLDKILKNIVSFKIRLPQRGLVTSLESKSVSVLYTIQLELKYRDNSEFRNLIKIF